MGKNVLIVEHNTDSLIRETANVHRNKYLLGGIFTQFGIKNRNERIYTWDKFQPAFDEMRTRISEMVVYGEFDHPDTFDTSLKFSSHVVTEASYDSSKNVIVGKIDLLSTKYGKQARAVVNDGYPLFVSSRAAGVTEANGEVTLKKLFTYDIVADPGFASARMSSINESVGYTENANFRIYDIGDDIKINELFTMNGDDSFTKRDLNEYSQYLIKEINSTKKRVEEVAKKGTMEPKKFDELLEYYESIQSDFTKMTKYLDYLAGKLNVAVQENATLKKSNTKLEKTTEKLIKHNDYLVESLNKTIGYTEYLAENVDRVIQYGEYIAEQLDKSIDYSNYIAENLDKTIGFGDYLAENLNKSIMYSEYIGENLDTNIAYSEYIAEHLDDNLAYSDYLAEQLDKSVGYSKMISEKLNSGKLNEAFGDGGAMSFPMPQDAGFNLLDTEEEEEDATGDVAGALEDPFATTEDPLADDAPIDGEEVDGEGNCRVVCDDDQVADDDVINVEDTPELEAPLTDEEECEDCEDEEEEGLSLTESIEKLIAEAKKRKASETNEHHFLTFLNKDQVDSYYNLTQDEQEEVAAYVNEKGGYYTAKDVLMLIREVLASKEETLEARLVRLMPEPIHESWGKMTEQAKISILSQAKLHPSNTWNDGSIEHFWLTRRLPVITEKRELIDKPDKLISDDKLSEDAMTMIMEKFRRI